MKRLLVIYPELLPHRFEDFIQDRKLERRGDLAIMANLNVSHILEHQFIPKQNSTYHNMGPKKRKILLLGDSFADLFFKDYFRRHFHDVKYIFAGGSITSPLEKGIVPEYQPDVVIFETVERYWTIISA
jgi:hypothetical protein